MVFSYYARLNPSQKRIYRKSDAIHIVKLPNAETLRPLVLMLVSALRNEDRDLIQQLSGEIAGGITTALDVPPLLVHVLAVRPSESWGELHGLFVPAQGRAAARITVWMRTARRRRVVAFRSFFRTLLHEICHHIDYELFKLEESYHTEGFYRRESSLFHQLFEVAEQNTEQQP